MRKAVHTGLYAQNTQWTSGYTAKEQHYHWGGNPLVSKYTRKNLEFGLYAKTRERRTIPQKNSAICKIHEVQLLETALPVEETNNKVTERRTLSDNNHGAQLCETALSVENNTKTSERGTLTEQPVNVERQLKKHKVQVLETAL